MAVLIKMMMVVILTLIKIIKQVREETENIVLSLYGEERDCSMTDPLSMKEVKDALKKGKTRKAPGPDGITGEMLKHLSSQKKEGKKSNPHRICHTEKSKLLSIIKRKPSSTARLKDTTQTRTRSISWHDTNRPSSFASEQATADWIAISRGLA